jgi:hypothetical protein
MEEAEVEETDEMEEIEVCCTCTCTTLGGRELITGMAGG